MRTSKLSDRSGRRPGAGLLTATSAAFMLVIGAGFAVLPASAARAADCEAIRADATDAVDRKDALVLSLLAEQVMVEPGCSEDFRRWIQAAAGNLLLAEVLQKLEAGEALVSQQGKLERAARLSKLWLAEALLGDIGEAAGDYATATTRFQAALQIIDDPVATERAPDQEVIADIFRKAERTRLLAEQYARVPRNRDGSPTGLGAPSVRGFTVTKVAIPIRFQFDSTQFSPEGRKAAEDLLETLLAGDAARPITLVGHTDAKGTADYNLELSLRRAEALGAFLASGGFKGEIAVDGRGEAEPFDIPQADRFTPEQLDQLHRRVELLR